MASPTQWTRVWVKSGFLPGESQGWGSLMGCRHGVAQSRTRLKRRSSSSSSSILKFDCLSCQTRSWMETVIPPSIGGLYSPSLSNDINICTYIQWYWASLVAQTIKNLPAMQETSFSRGSSQPSDQTHVFYIGRGILYHCAT